MKTKQIMSVSLPPAMKQSLADTADRMGMSVSELIRYLVDKFLPIMDGQDIVPVILKIPSELRRNPKGLKQWLELRVNAIVKKLV